MQKSNIEIVKEHLIEVASNPDDVDIDKIAVMIDNLYSCVDDNYPNVCDAREDNTPAGYHQRNILNPNHIGTN